MKKFISIILTLSLSLSTLCCVNCFASNETTCDNTSKTSNIESTSNNTCDTIRNIYGDGKSPARKKSSTFKKFLIGTAAVFSVGALAAVGTFFYIDNRLNSELEDIATKIYYACSDNFPFYRSYWDFEENYSRKENEYKEKMKKSIREELTKPKWNLFKILFQ